MFAIFKFTYVGRGLGKGAIFEIFARKAEFADDIVKRLNAITDYNLRRKRLFFKKKYLTDTPPYEVEQAQEESISQMEEDYYAKKELCSNNSKI